MRCATSSPMYGDPEASHRMRNELSLWLKWLVIPVQCSRVLGQASQSFDDAKPLLHLVHLLPQTQALAIAGPRQHVMLGAGRINQGDNEQHNIQPKGKVC